METCDMWKEQRTTHNTSQSPETSSGDMCPGRDCPIYSEYTNQSTQGVYIAFGY